VKKILLLLFALVFLSSCAGPQGPTLKVSMSLSDEEWKIIKSEIIPAFEKQNECRVETVQIEAGDLPQTLKAMSSAGKMEIDVFAQDNMRLSALVEEDLVEDLSEYRKMIPRQTEPALIGVGEFDKKLYFMPYRPNVQIIYYNEDAFKKYALPIPRNWDELLYVAKVFKQKEKVGRILLKAWGNGPTVTQLYEMIVSAGGDPFRFNDDGCVRTFEYLKKLWPFVSPDSLKAKWNTSNDYIARESVYLMQNWPFGINIIVEDYKKRNIKTYHGFSGPRREAHVIGGDVLGIPKGSKNKDLAVKFIKYLQSRDVQRKLMEQLSWPSIRSDTYGVIKGWRQSYFKAVREALKFGVFRKNVPYWADFDRFMNEAFVKIVIKGEPVKITLDHYAREMSRIEKK
jgi:trehalose transport system substrate-binding protein